MCSRIKNVLTSLKDVIDEDEGEVIISSLCPRADEMDKVEAMNKALKCLVRNYPYAKFMEQKNIESSMLRDIKHFDREDFTTLLANIRFALFGRLPRYFKKKPTNVNNADRFFKKKPTNVNNADRYFKKKPTNVNNADRYFKKKPTNVNNADRYFKKKPTNVNNADRYFKKKPTNVNNADRYFKKKPTNVNNAME